MIRAGICWISDFLRHHGWSFACYIQLTRDCKNKLRNVQMFLCLAVWQFKLFCLIVPLFSLTTQNTKPCMFQYLLCKSPLCGIHTDDIQSNLKLNRREILTRNFTLQFWICAEYQNGSLIHKIIINYHINKISRLQNFSFHWQIGVLRLDFLKYIILIYIFKKVLSNYLIILKKLNTFKFI